MLSFTHEMSWIRSGTELSQFLRICPTYSYIAKSKFSASFCVTVELQWLKHLWDHENLFETGVVRANEG